MSDCLSPPAVACGSQHLNETSLPSDAVISIPQLIDSHRHPPPQHPDPGIRCKNKGISEENRQLVKPRIKSSVKAGRRADEVKWVRTWWAFEAVDGWATRIEQLERKEKSYTCNGSKVTVRKHILHRSSVCTPVCSMVVFTLRCHCGTLTRGIERTT